MKKSPRRRARKRILMLICALVFVLCLSLLIRQYALLLQGRRARSGMQELYYGFGAAALAEEALNSDMPIAVDELRPTPAPDESFSRLLEANPDTVGWLKVGDIIDFAVVQRDNAYYLDHNFFGVPSAEGTAFMDEGCTLWPEDDHLIIHGHNMRNGSVFGQLKCFRDLDFLKENAIIRFNTLYSARQYVPFAVFDISAEPGEARYMDLQQFNFRSSAGYSAFIEDARQRSCFEIPVDVAPGDSLLSLVTCSYYDVNGRLVVMLRALRDGEDPQQISQQMQAATAKN